MPLAHAVGIEAGAVGDHVVMRRRSSAQRLVDAPRSRALGVVVVAVAVGLTTLLIYPLKAVAPEVSPGIVYLLAVLLVSMYWGLRLGLLTGLVSGAAFNFFHIPPTGGLDIAESAHWVALAVFLVAAAVASVV